MRARQLLVVFFFAGCSAFLGNARAGHNEPPRRVSVTILIDKDLLEKNGASVIAETEWIIRAGSRIYEKEFQIQFAVGTVKPWEIDPAAGDINAATALREVDAIADMEPTDITVAFTPKELFHCIPAKNAAEKRIRTEICGNGEVPEIIGGYAGILGNAAVITLRQSDEKTFIHEMGHLFGAGHVKEVSVMNGTFVDPAVFDQKSRTIIMRNRTRIFDKIQFP